MSENLTAEELADLKAKALKVLGDPWELWCGCDGNDGGHARHDQDRFLFVTDGRSNLADDPSAAVGEYIVAFQPSVTLRLLTALEEAEARAIGEENRTNQYIEEAYYEVGGVPHLWSARAEKAEQQAVALEKALQTVRTTLRSLQPALNVMAREVMDDINRDQIDAALSPNKSEADSNGQ